MSDQLLMTVLFMGLLYGLIFTKWAAEWVFVCIMLATYFAGLVTTDEVLDKVIAKRIYEKGKTLSEGNNRIMQNKPEDG